MKKEKRKKEEIAEDYCFICKDGGLLVVCEHAHCLKSYHTECLGKDSTLLETNDRWICSWHSCFICNKASNYQCFCCPISVCRRCITAAMFVRVRKKKGFCNDCLKLALLSEENLDVDSDGDEVDFKDRNTYECLFKEYWEIINKKEKVTLEDLHRAHAMLKKGESKGGALTLDDSNDDEAFVASDDDGDNDESNYRVPKRHDVMNKRSRKKEFTSWGSIQLIQFLTSIGKSTNEPLTQFDVYDIIMNYIQENKLLHPLRKKKVLCDARLHTLFRRKSVNRHKISELLEAHFPERQIPEDNSISDSEDENVTVPYKRKRRSKSDGKTYKSVSNAIREKIPEVPEICYASVTAKNIKLVYLRRTLIEEFLKNPDTFDNKVLRSFVRVKCDPKDCFSRKSFFEIMQVTAISQATEAYTIGDASTNIYLQVSNMNKAIRICMLSDDDFTEEECEDLRQQVKLGLLGRPTIEEFDEKARTLHEDITNHWIDREIVMLQKLIDRANEKGWRKELYEYIEKRERLQTPAERLRLLKESPQVIADAEMVVEDLERVTEGTVASPNGSTPNEKIEGLKAGSFEKPMKRAAEGEQQQITSSGNKVNAVIDLTNCEESGCAKDLSATILSTLLNGSNISGVATLEQAEESKAEERRPPVVNDEKITV